MHNKGAIVCHFYVCAHAQLAYTHRTKHTVTKQNYLGSLYYEGRGVQQDNREAARWFKRSAKQGLASACNNLGLCYEAGAGVDRVS
jgi:TPR repeat protein